MVRWLILASCFWQAFTMRALRCWAASLATRNICRWFSVSVLGGLVQPLAVQVKDYTDDPVLQERFCEAYRAHNKTVHDKMIKAFPGTVEALAELASAGLKLGVVTSKRHAVAWRGLEVVGAASYLDCCVGWDDIERPKPDPQPVVRGCELLGFDPSECLYVGDAPFDLQSGNAAGASTAAVTWGMFNEPALTAERPSFVSHTWDELIASTLALL